MKNEIGIKFIITPTEVFSNKKIDRTALLMYGLIYVLDTTENHCWASNDYFSTVLDVCMASVSASIKILIDEGYIEKVSFDGRRRTLKIAEKLPEEHLKKAKELNQKHSDFEEKNSEGSTGVEGRLLHQNKCKGSTGVEGYPLAESKALIKEISREETNSTFVGTKVPISGTSSADLKSKQGGTRKLIKRKPCSSGESSKADQIRKALDGKPLANKKPMITRKRKHKVRVPDNVQDVIDYWAHKGLPVHRPDTVSFATAVRYIKELYEGTLFNGMKSNYYHDRKFFIHEIKLSIDNFVLALKSNEHMPINKDWVKRITLSGFFYNSRAIKHPFLQYLAKPDLVINSKAFQSTDTKPVVTNVLLDWWDKFEESRHPMTVQVKNHCVLAGKKLEAFYEENKNRFLWGTHGNQIAILARSLTECLDKELRENDSLYSVFDSRWLISEKTFNERLPRYLISSKKMRVSKNGTAPETEYETIYHTGSF